MKHILTFLAFVLLINVSVSAQNATENIDDKGYVELQWPTYSKELERASKTDDKALVDLAICYGFGLGVKMDEKKCDKIFRENFGFNTYFESDIARSQPYASMWWGIFVWHQAPYESIIKKLKWDKENYEVNHNDYNYCFKRTGINYIEWGAEGGLEMAQLLFARSNRGSAKYSCTAIRKYNESVKLSWYVGYYEEALEWYNNACQHGNPYIMKEYADYLNEMIGYGFDELDVPDIFNQTLYCYKQAAIHGHKESHHIVGYIYEHGKLYIPKDIITAMEWYRKGIEKGDYPSYYYAAKLLLSQNDSEAVTLLNKGVENNDAESTYLLGYLYRIGKMVTCDANKAFELLATSFELGSLSGSYEWARCFDSGIGCIQDQSKALKIYTDLIESNENFPEREKTIARVACMYENGEGVFRNLEKAKYYRRMIE